MKSFGLATVVTMTADDVLGTDGGSPGFGAACLLFIEAYALNLYTIPVLSPLTSNNVEGHVGRDVMN